MFAVATGFVNGDSRCSRQIYSSMSCLVLKGYGNLYTLYALSC